MVTVIMTLTAKTGMSRDDFIRYYETKHLPLVLRLFPEIIGHSRNYPPPDLFRGGQGYDVVVEMTFDSEQSFHAAGRRRDDPKLVAELEHDESQFIDRSKIFMFVADQRRYGTRDHV